MAFLVLDSTLAALALGRSPILGYSALEPRPTTTGFVLNDGVLADPANEDVRAALSELNIVASPSFSGTSPGYLPAGVRPAPEGVTLLSATLAAGVIEVEIEPSAGGVDYEFRWGTANPPITSIRQDLPLEGWLEALPPGVPVHLQVRVRGSNSLRSPWSNVRSVVTPPPESPPTPDDDKWENWVIIPKLTGDYQWSVTGPSEVNEGQNLPWVLSCDLLGLTPDVGEIVSLTFFGQPIFVPGGFSTSIGDGLRGATWVNNIVDGTPRAGVTKGPDLSLLIDMNAWDKLPINIFRGTVERIEAQGDQIAGLGISDITKGVAANAYAEIIIRDVVTGSGSLEDFTVSGAVSRGGLDTLYVLQSAAQGIVIGDVVATAGILSSVAFVDNAGGRFQLVGNQLQVGASVLDFEEVQGDPGAGHGKPYELVTLRAQGPDAVTRDKVFKIAPEYAPIVATGGGAVSGTVYNTTDDLRSGLNSEVSPTEARKIVAAPNTIFEVGGNSATGINRSNLTFIGDFTSVTFKDRSFQIDGGTNIIIRGGVSAPGADPAGASLTDRDSLRISHAGPLVDTLVIENFDFTLSTDEILSIISGAGKFARRIVIRYNFIGHPMQNTGRTDGEDFHPFGLLVYNGQADVVIELNFFSGCAQRSPFMHKSRGVLIQNNIIAYRGDGGGYGGTQFSTTKSGATPNEEATAILRGNLYWPHPGDGARANAINFHKITSGTYIHVVEAGDPDSGAFPNHFFNPTTMDFSDDPILRTDIRLRSSATREGAIDWDPFKPADYGAYETDSPLKRETFFRNEFLKMGACKLDVNGDIIPGIHNQHLYDVKMALLNGGGYDGAATPANIDERYGVDWNTGGTRGFINAEAPPIVLP